MRPHDLEGITTQLERATDAAVRDALPPVARGLAVLYTALGVSHLMLLGADAGIGMAATAFASAALFAAISVLVRRRPLALEHAHPIAATVAAVVMANGLLHLSISGDPIQTTSLMLLSIGVGLFVLSPVWLVALLVAIAAGWALVITAGDFGPGATHFGFALGMSMFLAAMVHVVRNQTHRRLVEMQEQLADLALLDELTGLHNRRGFELLGAHELAVAARAGRGMILIYVDLDNMKTVNDTYGHREGDRLLVDTAALIRGTFRESDVAARIGGDEFCVLVSGGIPGGAQAALARLERAVARHNAGRDRRHAIELSAGTAVWAPKDPGGVHALVEAADAEMYKAKMDKIATRLLSIAARGRAS